MTEPIRDTETAVRELGALPVPVGPEPQMPSEQRAAIAELLGDAKPATARLVEQLAQSVRDRREHEHPTWEDLYCLNLVSWMGERMGPVLRRLLDTEARIERRRARLVALQNDALNMRGALSPNGEERKVPFPLGETLTPAVEWLINRVVELEAELYTEQAQHRTTLEQRNMHAGELLKLRPKYAEAAATVAQLVQERGERMKVENALRDRVTELEVAAVEGRAALAALCHDLDDPGSMALGALYLLQQATPGTPMEPGETVPKVYRASHDSIVMGLYTTATEARTHCVAEERRSWAKSEAPVFDWIEDEEDGVAELVTVDQDGETETITGYVVDVLNVAVKYDEGADE